MIETKCRRCGKTCQSGVGNPEARLLKRGEKGYCADCALTNFLKTTEPLGALIEENGVGTVLRDPNFRTQIARLLIVGKSDAAISDIDVERVIDNWGLPTK